jgi:DNA polymerase IIIc chi subunit
MGYFKERYDMGFYSDLDIEIMDFVRVENPSKEQIRERYSFLTDEDINDYIERNHDGELQENAVSH